MSPLSNFYDVHIFTQAIMTKITQAKTLRPSTNDKRIFITVFLCHFALLKIKIVLTAKQTSIQSSNIQAIKQQPNVIPFKNEYFMKRP